jgi:hypothetical protein
LDKEKKRWALTSKIKSSVERWSKLNAEEFELLFKIPFGLSIRRLQFHEVRKCVKKILWKIASHVLKEHHTLKCDIRNTRQLLQDYRFGSCNENKKGNYTHNLKNNLILDIYRMEYRNAKSSILEDQWSFIYQF